MNPAAALKVITTLGSVVELATEAGIDIHEYLELRRRARAENREITEEELDNLIGNARDTLEDLRDGI